MKQAHNIRLLDSRLTPECAEGWFEVKAADSIICAANRLNESVREGKVQCCCLSGRPRLGLDEDVVQCYVTGVGRRFKNCREATEVKFTTSHYVGQATVELEDDRVQFRIIPRMGRSIWRHMLGVATSVYLPERFESCGVEGGECESEWLLLLMWRNALESAMRKASMPKAYVSRVANLRCFKGRLDVAGQIRENLANQSRFVCRYKPLTFDNTINRTIRAVYHVLVNSRLPAASYASIGEHDARLASFGVGNSGVTLREVDSINYTRMTEPYRPVMELSKILLRGYGAGEIDGATSGPSYFVDVAEIWENYLLQVLKRRMPEYSVVSPNATGGEPLLQGAREVRPDFLVYRGDKLVAVMDAKYKHYARLGRYASSPNAVSRDDLYQVATYMYRFANADEPFGGIILSPHSVGDEQPMRMANNPRHFMAVCNLPIIDLDRECANWDRTKLQARLKEVEGDFAARLKKLLDGCLS